METRPTGTVTFLFTDIEGATRLWEAHPEGLKAALALHDSILRAAIDRHDGAVFSTGGDGFAASVPVALLPLRLQRTCAAGPRLAVQPPPGPGSITPPACTDSTPHINRSTTLDCDLSATSDDHRLLTVGSSPRR